MEEQAHVSMYRIRSCGYYRRGERDVAQFGSLPSLLTEMQQWGRGRLLGQTKCFDSTDSILPAYLVDVRASGNNWLLTLWNEIESTEGGIASMDGMATVGRADATLTELDANAIPGFPTYFWFLPDRNLLATVRVDQRSAGHSQMNRYLQGFLHRFTSHVVVGDELGDNGEVRIVGYRQSATSAIMHFRPRFESRVLTKAGPIDWLRDRADRINRVTRHGELALNDRVERQLWEKALDRLGLTHPAAAPITVKMNYDIEVNGLTGEEFDNVIEEWTEEPADLNRYGFRIRGDSTTYWLDHAYVRDSVMVDINRRPGRIIEPDSLLTELLRHRGHFIGLTGN